MAETTEPCLGPHTCWGCDQTITAPEYTCPDCFTCLPKIKRYFISSVIDTYPKMAADALWGARKWLHGTPRVLLSHDDGPEPPRDRPCPGRCGTRVPVRMVACQNDWLQVPPHERIALWEAWDQGPEQLTAALTNLTDLFGRVRDQRRDDRNGLLDQDRNTKRS